MPEKQKIAIIMGAGPAGLTVAYELLSRTDYLPVILEATDMVGGISRTVVYKGNRMDIGGHRFFSKSDRVMKWWLSFLPLQELKGESSLSIKYHRMQKELVTEPGGPDPEQSDLVMLVRKRLSRILYLRKFFDYPVKLNATTFRNLGLRKMAMIGISYIQTRLFPIKIEKNLEDFFINRFGKVLYETFFKDYTEKVWGVPCSEIKPEWGAQRIKGLSVSKAIWHALRTIVPRSSRGDHTKIETSLIDRFLYPKYGPGQLWEEVRDQVLEKGGQLLMRHQVIGLQTDSGSVKAVEFVNLATGEKRIMEGDLFFSTIPVRELISGIHPPVPNRVREISDGLVYRDFIAVGVLLKKMKTDPNEDNLSNRVPDNWIYIQESDVKVGRIQVFNNWSPYMVADQESVWLGMEYFCDEGDDLWVLEDDQILDLALNELIKIGLAEKQDFLDGTAVRMPRTYPAYFGSYAHFEEIRNYTDQISNLYLLGRNGMHKYNNQDHSMLTAMTAVDNIVNGVNGRDNIWAVNTEDDYHEESE